MRVGLDHHPARTHWPGVGRYSRELARALARLPDGPEVVLADVGRAERTIGEPALGLADAPRPPRVVTSKRSRRAFSLLHRSVDRMLGGVDLFHRMLPDWPPVARARELLPVAELPPEGSEAAGALAEAARRCGDAVVFGEAAVAPVAERLGLAPERVHAVPVGCDHWSRELRGEPPPRKDPPHVVVLGRLRPGRRPERVLRAMEVLKRRRREVHLLYVGGRGEGAVEFLRNDLGSSIARDWVLWNEFANEGRMPRMLAEASALVHLSDEELTAVTPLEAFSSGTPVVATRLPAFEEALGEEAVLLDDESPDALADALLAAVESATDAAARARREAIAARYTWEANARATVAVWQRIVGAS